MKMPSLTTRDFNFNEGFSNIQTRTSCENNSLNTLIWNLHRKDRSLGMNKTKILVQKHKDRSSEPQWLIFENRRIFKEDSIWRIDPFISVTVSLRFLKYRILIFPPKIDAQDSDFSLLLQNAIFSKEKSQKVIFTLRRGFFTSIFEGIIHP